MDHSVETIATRVRNQLALQLGVDVARVGDDATVETLGGDSLDAVECVMAIEDEFGIEVPDQDAEARLYAGPVSEWIKYVEERRAAAAL